MAALACPRCGSPIAGPELPGQAVVCPACGSRVRVGREEDVAAPPRVATPTDAWATHQVSPPQPPQPPGQADSPSEEIVLPFDPQAERAVGLAEPLRPGRLVRLLAALAILLVALIGAVLIARSLRPLMGIPAAEIAEWARRLQSGTPAQRQEVAREIVDKGPQAVAAVLDQITLEDTNEDKPPHVSLKAMRALAAVEPDTAADLREALRGPKANVRIGAAGVLREMGALVFQHDDQNGRDVLADLVAALDDENRWVRCYALEAIGNMGAEAESAVPAVVARAGYSDTFMRRKAIEALARIGPAAEKKAASRLKKIAEDDRDASCKQAARTALDQIELPRIARDTMADANAEVRELCRMLLEDVNDEDAAVAAKTLGEMGLRAKDAAPTVALALRPLANPRLPAKLRRVAAAKAIRHLAAWCSDYRPTIEAAAKDADPDLRAAAEEALAAVDGSPPH